MAHYATPPDLAAMVSDLDGGRVSWVDLTLVVRNNVRVYLRRDLEWSRMKVKRQVEKWERADKENSVSSAQLISHLDDGQLSWDNLSPIEQRQVRKHFGEASPSPAAARKRLARARDQWSPSPRTNSPVASQRVGPTPTPLSPFGPVPEEEAEDDAPHDSGELLATTA
eukprot:m.319645 g.319645  ORF g.319645 m.319645 type:complete len:168 (+) comp16448_c0_seq1:89-592(+)